MSIYALIKQAVVNKQQVFAVYNGHDRQMCPHVIGTKNGRPQALFYQFGGSSSSGHIVPGSPQNWRCIPIEELQNVRIVDGPWHTANNHSQSQTCVDVIDAEVRAL